MATLVNYNGLEIIDGGPVGAGGAAIQSNFVSLVDWSPQSQWSQSSGPSSSDDVSANYFPGSQWTTLSPFAMWVCKSNSASAAVWVPILLSIVQDTSPVLGGNLNVNGKTITTVSGGDIVLSPSSGGDTVIGSGELGVGTSSPNSLLQVAGPIATAIVTNTSAYTITGSDSVVLCDATSAAFTVSLISAGGIAGRQYTFKLLSSGSNNVTIAAYGSESIDGASTQVLATQYQSLTIVSDGSNWYII